MAKKYKKSEVTELLVAMERKAKQVLSMVQNIETDANKNSYAMYDDFVRRAMDFDTLAILVGTRLQNMELDADSTQELRDQYNKLKIVVAHGQIKASMKFFFILSATATLPLGAKDLFSSELRRLFNLQTELANPKYEGMLSKETMGDLETAELILQEIIDKAPGLLNFS
ncbi:MAG: hypothetical protein JKX94_11600 [Sneathiella sp.]|nr:hypothetical protein [Sneathiella sp.]